jgi:hypothetical protein
VKRKKEEKKRNKVCALLGIEWDLIALHVNAPAQTYDCCDILYVRRRRHKDSTPEYEAHVCNVDHVIPSPDTKSEFEKELETGDRIEKRPPTERLANRCQT